jgi:predicted extracellular nuclease
VSDVDANDPPDTMAANHQFSFTTSGPPALIREIQGESHIPPKSGMVVESVPGIVTATRSKSFYFQDPNPDSNVERSEGIFVFTSSATSVVAGADMRVSGRVTEFRTGGTGGSGHAAKAKRSSPSAATSSASFLYLSTV